jgi:hypothetical protein
VKAYVDATKYIRDKGAVGEVANYPRYFTANAHRRRTGSMTTVSKDLVPLPVQCPDEM